jgi:hypothetical protein
MEIALDPRVEEELKERARQAGKPVEVFAGELLADALGASGNGSDRGVVTDPAYEPSRTELGRTLRALRRKYIEGGGKLYSTEEINREVAEGRGER